MSCHCIVPITSADLFESRLERSNDVIEYELGHSERQRAEQRRRGARRRLEYG